MAGVIILYQYPASDELLSFEWDCTISEAHEQTGTATQWPVEDGSDISDHIDLDPKRISMDGFISDTPIKPMESFPLSDGNSITRKQQAWDALTTIHRLKLLCTVSTDTELYESMAITSLSTDKTRQKHGGLWASVQMKEVRLVQSQEVRIKDNPAPIKGPKPSDDDVAARRESKKKLGRVLLKFVEETERQQDRLDQLAAAESTSELNNLELKFQAEDLARGVL